MNEIIAINPEEKEDYEGHLFMVCLWGGIGYTLDTYYVYGTDNNIEEMIGKTVAYISEHDRESDLILDINEVGCMVDYDYSEEYQDYCEEHYKDFEQYDHDLVDQFIEEYLNLIYIDATEYGANQPYYIRSENLRIEKVS